jgi:hypothetical protein
VTVILFLCASSHFTFFLGLEDPSSSFRLVTMRSFFSGLIGITALLSLSANVLASDGASCAAYIPDDNSYFSVVGVQGTGVHPRQDIRELEKDTETWNLFLQALARFQAMDQDKKLSYYQVAGRKATSLPFEHD